MSQDSTIRTLITELMAEYDSGIDTAPGSPFDTTVMTPLLERIGGSPLNVNFEEFVKERLRTEFDDIDVSDKSGIVDLLVKPAVVILDPIRREINSVRVSQSLNNFESMTRDELNALLGNFFTSLQEGGTASGVVRMFFLSPQSVVVTPLTRFSTGGGLNFYPIAVQSISQELMAFNIDSTLYFFDVTVQAEAAGEDYNVPADTINTVQGIAGAVRVRNLDAFDNATPEETKAEAVSRAQESITVRNLAVERGIEFVLRENFRQLSTTQVIGKGDPEMLRDIVRGPVAVSDIPGGIIGEMGPGVGSGQEIHIGGKTDVYVYQRSPVSDTLDIQNLTNRGVRLFAGNTGFTQAGPATTTFEDLRGNFTLRGIQPGDTLRVGNVERTILSLTNTALSLNATVSSSLFNQDYEVVRISSTFIQAPLYDLIAVDTDGDSVFDEDGDPVSPIPGDADVGPLTSGSALVKKTANIASNNVQLPVIRVSSVEFLDPLTLEASGVTIPMKDVLLAVGVTAMSGGGVGVRATGTIRVYFRDPVSMYVSSFSTVFSFQTTAFRPVSDLSGLADVTVPGFTVRLLGVNYSSTVKAGYRIAFDGRVLTVVSVSYSAPNTLVVVREAFTVAVPPTAFSIYVGTAESEMERDPTSRLYYFDIPVEASLTGSSSNLPVNTEFSVSGLVSEGWSLRTTIPVLSFSTKELPYLELTPYVNDSTDLLDPGTAYAIRVNYDYASQIPSMQEFVESSENRIVGEDILVRHFLPSYVRVQLAVRGVDNVEALDRIRNFIADLPPTDELEASDIVDELYSVGATRVELPFTLVSMTQSTSRAWSARLDEDTLGGSRIQHFLPEPDEILFTEA